MILRIKCDPLQLLSLIYCLRTEKPCIFEGSATRNGVKAKVTGTILAAHPESSSFSMYVPEAPGIEHVA